MLISHQLSLPQPRPPALGKHWWAFCVWGYSGLFIQMESHTTRSLVTGSLCVFKGSSMLLHVAVFHSSWLSNDRDSDFMFVFFFPLTPRPHALVLGFYSSPSFHIIKGFPNLYSAISICTITSNDTILNFPEWESWRTEKKSTIKQQTWSIVYSHKV